MLGTGVADAPPGVCEGAVVLVAATVAVPVGGTVVGVEVVHGGVVRSSLVSVAVGLVPPALRPE